MGLPVDVACRSPRAARSCLCESLGIDPDARIPVPRVDLVLGEEAIERLRREPETLFVSATLWDELGAAGEVTPLAVRQIRIGATRALAREVSLGGTFELGFHSLAQNLVITSESTARAILGLGERASYLGVALDDPYRSERFVEELAPRLDEHGLHAVSWSRVGGGDFESIQLFRWILFVVLALSFAITAVGIHNALTILTLERRHQIGVLRAMGLRDRSIRWIFLNIACGIGLLGTLPGSVLGAWLGLRFGGWLDRELAGVLPIGGVEMDWHPATLAQALVLVLLVCVLTSAFSVGRALSLDPVDCLREE